MVVNVRNLIAFAIATPFAVMAYLQLNDPDPLYWVSVYLAVAAVPVLQTNRVFMPAAYYVVAGLVLAGLLGSAAGFVDYLRSGDPGSLTGEMLAHKPYVESAREFLGLTIAAVALACYRPGREGSVDKGSMDKGSMDKGSIDASG